MHNATSSVASTGRCVPFQKRNVGAGYANPESSFVGNNNEATVAAPGGSRKGFGRSLVKLLLYQCLVDLRLLSRTGQSAAAAPCALTMNPAKPRGKCARSRSSTASSARASRGARSGWRPRTRGSTRSTTLKVRARRLWICGAGGG